MAGIRQVDWEDIIHETALNAADAWRKYLEDNGSKVDDAGEKNTYEKVFNRLMQEYPYEEATMDTMKALYDYKPETVWRWVINGTTDPRKEREALEASKFLPYLMGHEKDWTKTPTKALQEMATNDLKYPYTKEGYAQFLRELGAQQEKADRAQVLKELRSMPQYYAALAAYPSLVEAIDNAVATGEDLDDAEIAKLIGLDAGVDMAQVIAPGMGDAVYVKNPVLNSGIGAGIQGIAEIVRQYGKQGIDGELRADMTAPVMATTLGATRPGMVGTAQMYASKFQGPAAQNFSRGVMRALKAGDPMDIEEKRIAETAKLYNQLLGSGNRQKAEQIALEEAENSGSWAPFQTTGEYMVNTGIAKGNRILGAGKIKQIAEALGVKPDRAGYYNVDELLKAYRKTPNQTIRVSMGDASVAEPVLESTDKIIQLTPKQKELYSANLPAKYSFEDAESKARSAGLILGKILGDYGSRIEPVMKANPFNVGRDYIRPYQKESWYLKLSPEQRKVIDDAMKEKEEE